MGQSINFLKNKQLPYYWYIIPVIFFLLFGLTDTLYLAWSHYKNYTDLTFSSFCAISKAINCDTVSQSPWSILLGLPLSYWGFFAYLLFLLLALATLYRKNGSLHLWQCLFLLGLGYSMASLYFAYISATKIKAHCILCLGSHAASFALFFLSWIILRRFCGGFSLHGLSRGVQYLLNSWPLKTSILVFVVAFLSLHTWLPPYWNFALPSLSSAVASGLTEEGHPWIGAENPELTIHEYTDYQCFQCSKMHAFLRQLINQHPQKIRLVHHHYPMDHEFNSIIVPEPFHIGSGKMAMIAIYAVSKNKFWEMNDALYAMGREKEPFNTRTLAAMTGFTSGELAAATRHPQIREILLYDIRQGMKREIIGTPTFVIDDKVYAGSIPATILQKGLQ